MTHIPFTAEEPLNTAYSEGAIMSRRKSARGAIMILVVYVLSTWAGAAAVQAQVPFQTLPNLLPTLSNRCGTRAPRSTIVNCNLENPSVHQVKVEIRIQAGNLAYSGPASVTVGNGLSASFQVTLRADLRPRGIPNSCNHSRGDPGQWRPCHKLAINLHRPCHHPSV